MAKPVSAIGSEIDLLQCPYNVSHIILRQRFQVHLVRCRRSHPNAEVVTCPFNITHRINKLELGVSFTLIMRQIEIDTTRVLYLLQWHVSICTERQNFENFRHSEAPIMGLTSSIDRTFCGTDSLQRNATFNIENGVTPVGGEFVEPSETWDDEPDVPSYNPNEYIEKADVLRMPVGLTPAQRNAFRMAERKRLQAFAKPK